MEGFFIGINMAAIDKYIEALTKNNGESLLIEAGSAVELIVGGAARKMGSGAPTAEQVLAIIGEVLAPDYRTQVEAATTKAFPYSSPHGAVTINVTIQGEKVSARIQPVAAAAASAPAAAPVAAPAAASAAEAPVASPVASRDTSNIDAMFNKMLDYNASDLHLKSGQIPMMRIDGTMKFLSEFQARESPELWDMISRIMPDSNIKQFKECMDTDFAYEIEGRARLRCNVFKDISGVGGVFRQIPSKILTVTDLNLPPAVLKLCDFSKGLILITGPTGSGKSTTLAAMIDYINDFRSDHIITIEDPVEFVHKDKKCLINQREVGSHTKSFKSALRAALREDPDIVLVGELRDLETTEIAIETAETGHLVFGTLHTNTAPSTVDRIIDQFPAERQGQIRTMLSESLVGVISQTLCKRAGKGRIAALEVLLCTSAVSNLIREGKTFQIPSIMQTSRKIGMQSLNDVLIEFTKKKLIEPEEAYMRAVSKKEIGTELTRAGFRGKWSEGNQ